MTTLTILTHSRCPYQFRSVLLHEPQPHDDHISVHVYIVVLHECKFLCELIEVILLPFHISTPNQIFAPLPSTCILISFIVMTPVHVLLIVLWC
jgi:hypothetical protein